MKSFANCHIKKLLQLINSFISSLWITTFGERILYAVNHFLIKKAYMAARYVWHTDILLCKMVANIC